MTGIAASNMPGFVRQAVTGRRSDAGAPGIAGADADTRTFTDALLTIDARAVTSPGAADKIAGGTMRPAAEAFGAHGLFDGSVPDGDAGGSAGADGQTPATAPSGGSGQEAVAAPAPAAVAASAPAVIATSAAGPGAAGAGALATAASVLPAAPRSSAAGPLAHLLWSGPAVVSGATILDAAAPMPGPAAVGGAKAPSALPPALADQVETALGAALDEARIARLQAAATDGGAASRLAVSLDADERGVAVTVAGAVPPGEEDMVRQAAARLLARHGLVMSALRIARYPSAERRHQGNR